MTSLSPALDFSERIASRAPGNSVGLFLPKSGLEERLRHDDEFRIDAHGTKLDRICTSTCRSSILCKVASRQPCELLCPPLTVPDLENFFC